MQVPVIPTIHVQEAARRVNGALIRYGHIIPVICFLACITLSTVVTVERQLVYTPFVLNFTVATPAPTTSSPSSTNTTTSAPTTTEAPPTTTTAAPTTTSTVQSTTTVMPTTTAVPTTAVPSSTDAPSPTPAP